MQDAFNKLFKFPLLAVIPIAVDGLSVLLGMAMHGFYGSPHLTFKLTLQMGLPSISAVTEQAFMPGSVQIAGSGGINPASMISILFYLALFLVVQSFMQGGYIGLLHEAVRGRYPLMSRFVAYGGHFFIRFFLLNVLVLTLLFVAGGLMTAFFGIPGMILFLLFFLFLRVLFLYLEFTLVSYDCSISEAFPRSREVFVRRTPVTLLLVGITLIINVIAGVLINALWLPLFFIVLLVLYDIFAAGLQLAFMHDFRSIRG